MITVAVLTLSDKGSKGERADTSGLLIQEMLNSIDAKVLHYDILPDEKDLIKEKLIKYSGDVDLILTTGGTGLAPRDVTPEATLEVTSRAMLSRAVAGVKGKSLIINLPGSPKAVREGLAAILDVIPHAIEKIKGDTSECATP
jgi:molybdopterin adenylyltransferase